MDPELKQELDTLQGKFEVMNLLTGKVISCQKVTPVPITQEVIDRVVAIAKKDGIKSPMNFNDCKEGTIRKDDDKNDDADGSIAGVNYEYED